MKIVIEIELNKNGTFRPTVSVGGTSVALCSCYSESDALADSLRYIEQERARGDYSKFALFHGRQGEASNKRAAGVIAVRRASKISA